MDNMNLIKKLPPMLSGSALEQALTILPEYNPAIVNENEAMRLIALSDLYKVYVPNQMSKEIYCKLYLALLRSLQKKQSKLAIQQYMENYKAVKQQEEKRITKRGISRQKLTFIILCLSHLFYACDHNQHKYSDNYDGRNQRISKHNKHSL